MFSCKTRLCIFWQPGNCCRHPDSVSLDEAGRCCRMSLLPLTEHQLAALQAAARRESPDAPSFAALEEQLLRLRREYEENGGRIPHRVQYWKKASP